MQEASVSILSLVFALTVCIQLYYYLKYFLPLTLFQPQRKEASQLNASVIIAVKNNAAALSKCISTILKQKHARFELIVIDDHSEEMLEPIIGSFKDQRILYHRLNEGLQGKKAAIQKGIELAKHEHLVFTDADCEIETNLWLGGLLTSFSEQTEIVLGHGRFYKRNSIMNSLQRFECLLNAVQYFSYALAGKAYMGVGRNLAYLKSTANKSIDVLEKMEVLSGDDDLLVNKMATASNVSILPEHGYHSISEAKSQWTSFVHQKRRQLQAGNHYKSSHRRLLAVYGAAKMLFYVSCLFLLLFSRQQLPILSIFVLELAIQMLLFWRLSKMLGDKDVIIWAVVLEPIYYILISLVGISTWIWKVKRWT